MRAVAWLAALGLVVLTAEQALKKMDKAVKAQEKKIAKLKADLEAAEAKLVEMKG